jgi:Hg(II)-responsive transcriptional regulator
VKIGEVAQQAGVRVQTLRYYERSELVPPPKRRASGFRDYPAETVQRVKFIKRAQRLGFTLDEIRDLLRLRSDENADCSAIREAAAAKARAIREKIRDLRAIETSLRELVESCRGDRPTRECSILGALEVPARGKARGRG